MRRMRQDSRTHDVPRRLLEAAQRALDQASSVLAAYPEQAFPQLYNRLHGTVGGTAIFNDKLEAARRVYQKPWLRLAAVSVRDPHLVRTLVGHTGRINDCAVSPDGRRILSASDDHTLRVWDFATGRELFTLKGHAGPVTRCSFSPDGERIVSLGAGDDANRLILWDARSGGEIASCRGHSARITCYAFSPDSRHVVTASEDRTLKVFDVETCAAVATLRRRAERPKSPGRSPSPDDVRVGPTACAYSPDSQRIISGDVDGALLLWNAGDGSLLTARRVHSDEVVACAFQTDGLRIVTCGGMSDMTIKVWEVDSWRGIATLKGHRGRVETFAISPDGKRIASLGGATDRTVRLWDADTHEVLAVLPDHDDRGSRCVFSPDSSQFITTAHWRLHLWKADNGEPLTTLEGHTSGVAACSYTPDGQHVVSGGCDNTLKVWVPRTTGTPARRTGHAAAVRACAFSPDGARVVSVGDDIRLWDGTSGDVLAVMGSHAARVESCVFSQDGTHIASASRDRTLRLWDARDGRELATLAGHAAGVTSCRFSPDGRRLVSASKDGTLRILGCPVAQDAQDASRASQGRERV